jgi:RHS repeat-associated protein
VTEYDDLGRPVKVRSAYDTALESWVQTIYDDEERRIIVKSDLETMGDGKKVAIQHFDQLGRVRLARTLEDAVTESATNEQHGIKVQTRYRFHSGSPSSSNGEYTLTSNPYRAATSSGASSEPTMGWTVEFESKSGNLKTVESFAGAGLPSLWGSNTDSTGKSEETEDANATIATDETGKVRRTITNALGQLIRVDEPDSSGALGSVSSPNQATEYSYDPLGNLLQIVQGGQTRTFTYSSLSRLLTANNPESGTFQFGYDSNGNLTSKTDARNITTTFTYDALNRATARNYSDSTPDVTYTYDDSQVQFSKGKLTKVASSVSESLITSYDARERITGSQQKNDGQTYSFSYTYNLDDDLLTQTYPSGKVVNFGYDSSGDLGQVSKSNGFVYANSFSYAPHGQVEKFRFGNGLWETMQFNSRRQITQIGLGHSATDTGFWKIAYEYGDWNGSTLDTTKNNNSLARQTITVPTIGAVTGFTAIQTYAYDSLDRLKSATETIGGNETWKQTFLYERFGNRNFDTGTTLLSNESAVTKVANPEILTTNNRFKLDQDNDSINDYEYDSSGNLTKNAQGRQFTFNAENLQITATASGMSFVYSYDGNNKRVKSYDSVNDKTTLYVYDASGRLAAEYTINVAPPTVPTISYLTEDALGSVRVTTNSFSEVKARRDFLPFGEELYAGIANRNTNQKYSSSTDDVRKKFATYQRDTETGLDFAQSRYYSPMHGRFTSPDEFKGGPDELFDFTDDALDNPTFYADLTNPQSLNKYQYAYNNPYKFNDPNGHTPIWLVRAAMALAAAASAAAKCIRNNNCREVVENAVKRAWDRIPAVGPPPRGVPRSGPANPASRQPRQSPANRAPNAPRAKPTRAQLQSEVRTRTKTLNEHKTKLENYKKDPDKYDNLGKLQGVSQQQREQIIQGRITKLENTIKRMEKDLEKAKKELEKANK